jgi:hypothetical protein
MRLKDRNDPSTYKVRRGKVGGYRDYFTPEQAEELEQFVYTRLSPAFGYGPEQAAAEPAAVSA